MIYSDRDIKNAISSGDLSIDPLDELLINPTSVDLHLGFVLIKYTSPFIQLGKTYPTVEEVTINPEDGYILEPGDFILGCTKEVVSISSKIQGWLETKGNIARAGLKVHNCDGHIDPGFSGTITLEISNHNTIPVTLYPGILICQIFFLQLTSECENPYSGKYNRQIKPSYYRYE